MSTPAGTWHLTMRTPIGTMRATMTLAHTEGEWTGLAHAENATPAIPLRDITVEPAGEGDRITWSQTITSPLRLNLDFDVIIVGEKMTGHSKAGRLPRTAVSGIRVAQ